MDGGGQTNGIEISSERNQNRFFVGGSETNGVIQPHPLLPTLEAPAEVIRRARSLTEALEASPAAAALFGKFVREKSNSFSEAITRHISSLRKEGKDGVKEFNLAGVRVTKVLKEESKGIKGRISFFSRSNCRDCGAVRSFFRERNLNFVEINVDVYPERQKELVERTAGDSVPQIFFNEKPIGGLVALNSLRNSGMLDAKLEEILGRKCPDDAPAPPVYGFDEAEEVEADDMAAIIRAVRQKVPIKDRIAKMKLMRNCFSGAELVEALIHHLDCGRRKAVEIGKQLVRKHFIHPIFGENDFDDGNHLCRFLEHEPFIPKCYNFRGTVNDSTPKDAAALSQKLACLMSAILESYASDDRSHLDYIGISNSEEFRRYVNLVEDLQRVNLLSLSHDERLAFFLNLHNAMALHAVIRIGHPGGMMDRMSFFTDFMYVVGGYSYSLSTLTNGILRSNRRPPLSLIKPFSSSDRRLELAFPKVNQLIHFGIWNASNGSPRIRFFTPQDVEYQLKTAAKEYFQRDDQMQVELSKRTVFLPRLIKWYSADFGHEKETLKWMINLLDPSKAGLVTHLLNDKGHIHIVYKDYDWSLSS
ncbi:uncharacterized protein LOC127263498 [Andrographis paniculata]|uniref:uncharacterized protein LOC127263498 n=1 Tax=Andrographis paniculata TaxID=175694 RepID=UPI0021E7FA1A|nr:uncharacterized protein LOC127263498 [Andrographis paniculata]